MISIIFLISGVLGFWKWATASVDSGSSGSSDMPKARDNFEENEAPF